MFFKADLPQKAQKTQNVGFQFVHSVPFVAIDLCFWQEL